MASRAATFYISQLPAACLAIFAHFARERGIVLTHAVVSANGGFDDEGTRSTGIMYQIEVQGEASERELADLVDFVQRDSSVPQILRHGAPVTAGKAIVSVAPSESRERL